jgi:hypothetical protein
MKTPGQVNYEGYYNCSGGVSLVSGAKLPTWEEQDPRICNAWEAAARDVLDYADQAQKAGDKECP